MNNVTSLITIIGQAQPPTPAPGPPINWLPLVSLICILVVIVFALRRHTRHPPAPQLSRYYYSRDGKDVEGPISEKDLRGMYSAGLLGDDAQVCAEGTEAWQPITVIRPRSVEADAIQTTPRAGIGKYVCPRCGSSNIQSVPLLYEAGTSTSVSSGRVVGVAGLGSDHLTPAGGFTTSTHRQQTLLAARYSPPRPQAASSVVTVFLFSAVFLLIAWGIGLFIVRDDTEISHPVLKGWLFLLAGIAIAIRALRELIVRGAKQQELREAYQKRLSDWQRSFVCQKCGYFGAIH